MKVSTQVNKVKSKASLLAKKARAKKLAKRLVEIEALLDERKALYAEHDDLVVELAALTRSTITVDGKNYAIKDNFKDKNTSFKAVGISRFSFVELKEKKRKNKED